jgi:hypothetical protein
MKEDEKYEKNHSIINLRASDVQRVCLQQHRGG